MSSQRRNNTHAIHISGVRYSKPVGKQIVLADDGERLEKDFLLGIRSSAGEMLNREFTSAQEFFEFRRGLDAHTMLFSGTFAGGVENKRIIPQRALKNRVISDNLDDFCAATKANLAHRDDASVLMIDIDRKDPASVPKLWPDEPTVFSTPEEVRDAILEILPEASGCPIIVLPSSSSMIERTSDGKLLAGAGGWRVYIPILSALDIATVLETVHARCWARERFHFAFVSRGGAIQFRSLADLAMKRPTQPDYPAASLGAGLRRNGTMDRAFNLDGPWLDGAAVCLSDEDRVAAGQSMARIASFLKPEGARVKKARMLREVKRAVEAGVKRTDAQEAARRKYEDQVLLGSQFVKFADGEEFHVEDLLNGRGEQFDGKECFDPIEPDYDGGRAVAKLFWNDGNAPVIHSFAHGDTNYCLRYDEESAQRAIEAADEDDHSIYRILMLAKDGTTATEYVRLERAAAVPLRLGNRLKGLRAEVAKRYRPIERSVSTLDRLLGAAAGSQQLDMPLPASSFPQKRRTEQGFRILDHQSNIQHLLASYGVTMRYNEITKEIVWSHPDILQRGDNAENALHSQVVSLCSLNNVPTGSLDLHLTALANRNTYNPVVEYLSGLKWDGQSRFDLLAEAMSPSDIDVACIAIRTFLLQACAAADHGGRAVAVHPKFERHFETVMVLVGDQGLGKTKGVRTLLPEALREFYKEGVSLDLRDKDSVKHAVSSWIVELGELDSTFRKSDIVQLKAFLSLSRDEIRMPYARKASAFHRRTSFVGTVNDMEFLADQTGNRRYIPLQVSKPRIDWSDEEFDQLWAEAWSRYVSGEKWWPDETEVDLLARNAEQYRARSGVEELIEQKYCWGEKPDFEAGRKTAAALARELQHGAQFVVEIKVSKTIGAALLRLWRTSGVAELRRGVWRVKNPHGEWVPVNAPSGKNRGWLLPPNRLKSHSADAAVERAQSLKTRCEEDA